MELWIRSQDREKLVLTKGFETQHTNYDNGCQIFTVWENNYQMVGKYATKERALEVLDEIQNKIHQAFICEIKILGSRDDYKRLKLDLENEYPDNEFIMQPYQYELKPINSNVVIYEMPKE